MSSSPRKRQKVPNTLIKVGKNNTTYQQNISRTKERAYGVTHEEQEENEVIIVDRSAAEIIDQINKRVRSPYYYIYLGIATIILLFIFLPLSIVLLIATYIVYLEDIKRKTTPLIYEFSDDYSKKKFHNIIASFSDLAATKNSWRLKSKIAVSDWKRNAGSNSTLIRHRSKIGKQNPKLLKTNIEVWGLDAGNIKLYLLPDRFFVFQDGIYSAIPYSEIQASLQDLEYVEQEALPNDSIVIGKTWKYVRRDGGPDRRFKNNRQLPIVKYGVLVFSSPNFTTYLIISSLKIAQSFTQSFSKILSSSSLNTQYLPPPPFIPSEENISLEHLAPLREAASQDSELTTSQIAQILGVSNSFITKNSSSFEYEGFRFSRSGRSGRQISWRIENLNH